MLEESQGHKPTQYLLLSWNPKMVSVAKYGKQHISRSDAQNPQ